MLPSLLFWAKLTVAFTCTSLPSKLYTSVFGCGYGFGFEQKFWQIDGFGEKEARIGGFAYPYSPPSSRYLLSRDEIGNFPLRRRAPLSLQLFASSRILISAIIDLVSFSPETP